MAKAMNSNPINLGSTHTADFQSPESGENRPPCCIICTTAHACMSKMLKSTKC